jgi:1-aminocyclopropane-1-carboxylate deaminase/D-cysteine desulfhydrase-like pyridoxal-dependent ACC family enzyme
MLGADIRFKHILSPELAFAEMEKIAEGLKREGRHPYLIPSGGASPLGVVGYVYGGIELAQQLLAKELPQPEAVVAACGSCGTLAGLLVAKRFLSSAHRLIGICVGGRDKTEAKEKTLSLARECAKLLRIDIEIGGDDLELYDEYIGEGYAHPNKRDWDAIATVLTCEGIFLDPVYTGRAMGGLIDLIRTRRIDGKKPIVFIHTGGTPALFAYGSAMVNLHFKGTV